MQVWRDLKLIGKASEQEKLIDFIEQQLSHGWTRNREREADIKSRSGYDKIVFSCSETGSRPAAELSFFTDEEGYLCVSNIVPKDPPNLEKDVYNAILEEFLTRFVEPAANGLDIQIVITPAELTIENAMSSEMARLLKQFSAAANQSSGATHPLDAGRFFDFIIQAHREESSLDETRLGGLLMEEGWSDKHAVDLLSKYDFGRDLLNYYRNRWAG